MVTITVVRVTVSGFGGIVTDLLVPYASVKAGRSGFLQKWSIDSKSVQGSMGKLSM